jgi:protein-disulfide isomerase
MSRLGTHGLALAVALGWLVTMPTPAPSQAVLDLANAPVRGSNTARVTLVEVSDFECPFCGRYARDIKPQIESAYVRTGKIRYAFLHMPVEARHKNALKASEAAACAGDQGKYWEMHDRLFANQAAIGPIHLPIHAQALGLKADNFKACLDAGRHTGGIRKDFAMAVKAGVTGTPTFFLGLTSPGSTTLKIVKTISGAKPYPVFKEALDALLASAPAAAKNAGAGKAR